MLGSFSSRVVPIGGLSARVTPTNSDGFCMKPRHQAFQTPSQARPSSEKGCPSNVNISPRSPMTLGSSENAVRKVNGEDAEVKVSPSGFKLGPEVPRTIYPGLDDFLPECDGEIFFIENHQMKQGQRWVISWQISVNSKMYEIVNSRKNNCMHRTPKLEQT